MTQEEYNLKRKLLTANKKIERLRREHVVYITALHEMRTLRHRLDRLTAAIDMARHNFAHGENEYAVLHDLLGETRKLMKNMKQPGASR